MRIRFSTKGFLIAFTLIAVAFAGLIYRTPMLASDVYTVALVVVLERYSLTNIPH
jgi:hypothetical protein